MPEPSSKPPNPNEFPLTRWSLLRRLGADESKVAGDALEALCQAYWYPLYAFLRRTGYNPDEAQDWTQGFFHYLLETELLTKADPTKGRFRSFLLGSLRNYLSSEHRRLGAAKRGGGKPLISLDEQAEARYSLEPLESHTPESLFELSWAHTVLARTMACLEQEYSGKHDWFLHLRPYLQSGPDSPSYRQTALALGKTEDAVKSGVQRLRQRFQQLLRAQIAGTVQSVADIEDELRHLRAVLSS